MAAVTGTSGNDFIHVTGDGLVAPVGDADMPLATNGDDFIDASQGGNDIIHAGGGGDIIYMGGALNESDLIDGGDNGQEADMVELNGNYVGFDVLLGGHIFFADTSLTFDGTWMTGVEDLFLQEGSGNQYKLIFTGSTTNLTVAAESLSTAPLTVDASGATGGLLTVEVGAAPATITGMPDGSLFVDFSSAPSADQFVHGDPIAAMTTVIFAALGPSTFTLDGTHFSNVGTVNLQQGIYDVTATDDLIGAGRVLDVQASGTSTTFDDSAETDGTLSYDGLGGDNFVKAGAGGDSLFGSSGNNVLSGGGGDDLITAQPHSNTTTRIDGGSGDDTVQLFMTRDDPVTLDAGALQNIEHLQLSYRVTQTGHPISLTLRDGAVSATGVLPVRLDTGGNFSPLVFDASAETHSAFSFTMANLPATGNVVKSGAGDDTFIVNDPSGTSGTPNSWQGGGGTNTLDYSGDIHPLTIDAAAGTATGTGAVADSFSGFRVFKFGTGIGRFDGSAGGDTAFMDHTTVATFDGNGGNDVVDLGAALNSFSVIDGGAGNDKLTLDGDYSGGLVFGANTVRNVETLSLASGHSYELTTNDATVAAGEGLAVDGSALGQGDALTFDGSAETDGHFVIVGGAGADTLTGGAGGDTLSGRTGADRMAGGAGNDTYFVDNAGDQVIEAANAGTDLVDSSISYTLAANVENLTLTGTANINGTGNSLANVITGNSGDNVLDGAGGADTMEGGAGNDTYVVDDAGDQIIELTNGGADLVESSISFALAANVENLTLTGTAAINGTGNALANTIIGNGGANELNGAGGADTMEGGAGDDTYVVDNSGDQVVEAAGQGTDLVDSAVTFTLSANVENLALTGTGRINGTGNSLANVILGNGAANVLNGGAGADVLKGGAGNDTYVVDNVHDTVVENADAGTDRVRSAVSFTLSANVENLTLTGTGHTHGTGNGLANVINGNARANVLSGGAGADALNGGRGADIMKGGTGNDTYVVDNRGDQVVEAARGGIDLVKSAVGFTLSANVENLTLTGKAAVDATGNALANVLIGNAAVNHLDGGAGHDTLTGGGGNDIFLFDVKLAPANADTITDFTHGHDRIELDHALFVGLARGKLAADAFVVDTAGKATGPDQHIIYDNKTGGLFYDQDGTGTAHDPMEFAILKGHPTIDAGDFLVI